jgi:hypothetical protein
MASRRRQVRRQQYSVPSAEIAAYAIERVTCLTCGAEPGEECDKTLLEWPRTVCKQRFTDAAVTVHRNNVRKSA